jgi:hypothetical protein
VRTDAWTTGALVIAGALLAVDLPYWSPGLRERGLTLLAYPRMYGTVILWSLAVFLGIRGGDRGHEPTIA